MAEGYTRTRARVKPALAPVPPVVGTSLRLVQVFLNLRVNAAQAIPPGRADGNRIAIRAAAAGDAVLVFAAIRERHPHLLERVIFMTGGTFTDEEQRFRASVSNPLLEKPLETGQLLALVAERLRAAPASPASPASGSSAG